MGRQGRVPQGRPSRDGDFGEQHVDVDQDQYSTYGPTTLTGNASAVLGDINNSYHYYLLACQPAPLLVDSNSTASLVAQLKQLLSQYDVGESQQQSISESISNKVEAWLSSAALRYEASEYGSIMTRDSAESVATIKDLHEQFEGVEHRNSDLETPFEAAPKKKSSLSYEFRL